MKVIVDKVDKVDKLNVIICKIDGRRLYLSE
jgi:hypothetical protein